jgi:hypothetical protein
MYIMHQGQNTLFVYVANSFQFTCSSIFSFVKLSCLVLYRSLPLLHDSSLNRPATKVNMFHRLVS